MKDDMSGGAGLGGRVSAKVTRADGTVVEQKGIVQQLLDAGVGKQEIINQLLQAGVNPMQLYHELTLAGIKVKFTVDAKVFDKNGKLKSQKIVQIEGDKNADSNGMS